jgi:hypothetical protein
MSADTQTHLGAVLHGVMSHLQMRSYALLTAAHPDLIVSALR